MTVHCVVQIDQRSLTEPQLRQLEAEAVKTGKKVEKSHFFHLDTSNSEYIHNYLLQLVCFRQEVGTFRFTLHCCLAGHNICSIIAPNTFTRYIAKF